MPTICFGFQVSPHSVSFGTLKWYSLEFDIDECCPLPPAVSRQLCAGVQQHEEERDQTVGTCSDPQHDNLPFCLHRNRYVSVYTCYASVH